MRKSLPSFPGRCRLVLLYSGRGLLRDNCLRDSDEIYRVTQSGLSRRNSNLRALEESCVADFHGHWTREVLWEGLTRKILFGATLPHDRASLSAETSNPHHAEPGQQLVHVYPRGEPQ